MKTVLLALNSKYIHTNLAIRYLREFAIARKLPEVELVEFTINHRLPFLLEEVYRKKPKVVFLSCYIWNIELMMDLAEELKKACPEVLLVAGGPEVSYDSRLLLEEHPFLDFIICGEGEIPFCDFLEYLEGNRPIEQVRSLLWRDEKAGGTIQLNPIAEALDMNLLPFPYPDIAKLENKILYFETIRGCPFRCSYCLSSIEKGVRYLSLEKALPKLQIFLDARVKQVKFVDRTFNCSKNHAMAIWQYLVQHDNGYTNFHFELTAHLLDEEMISFFKTVRKGLFQFEIGVQSTNPETIEQINRTTDIKKLLDICCEVDTAKNIHLHLDLIAGLPFEGLTSFGKSFDEVMEIRPQQLQLGFLKVLKGSAMASQSNEHGLVHSRKAPYEVISTKWLTFDHLLLLKDMESMVELYYNSGRFLTQVNFILKHESSPFRFFLELGQYYIEHEYHKANQSPENQHTILKDFFISRSPENSQYLSLFHDLCLYDLCLHEKPKKLPDWVSLDANLPHREDIRRFFQLPNLFSDFFPEYLDPTKNSKSPINGIYDTKQLAKLVHLQYFRFNPIIAISSGTNIDIRESNNETCFLFRYDNRDLLGHGEASEI